MTTNKILVVDDWAEILYLLRIQLSHLGWEPVLAESGEEALEKLTAAKPSVILLDMRMPDMDGLQLMRILKSKHPGIPVVVMTAFACPGEQRQLMDEGCHEWLSKPFTLHDLRECLSRVAGNPNAGTQISHLEV